MARVTIEDCIKYVDNKFELVILGAERTKQLQSGAIPIVEVGKNKLPTISIREIAAGYSIPTLRADLDIRIQKPNKIDDIENDDDPSMNEKIVSDDDFEYIDVEESFEDLGEDVMQKKD